MEVFVIFFAFLLGLIGWIHNILWTFHQEVTSQVILGAVGIFAFPIGVIHGLWTLFF